MVVVVVVEEVEEEKVLRYLRPSYHGPPSPFDPVIFERGKK